MRRDGRDLPESDHFRDCKSAAAKPGGRKACELPSKARSVNKRFDATFLALFQRARDTLARAFVCLIRFYGALNVLKARIEERVKNA